MWSTRMAIQVCTHSCSLMYFGNRCRQGTQRTVNRLEPPPRALRNRRARALHLRIPCRQPVSSPGAAGVALQTWILASCRLRRWLPGIHAWAHALLMRQHRKVQHQACLLRQFHHAAVIFLQLCQPLQRLCTVWGRRRVLITAPSACLWPSAGQSRGRCSLFNCGRPPAIAGLKHEAELVGRVTIRFPGLDGPPQPPQLLLPGSISPRGLQQRPNLGSVGGWHTSQTGV
jgi:hypothetical protein